MAALLTSNGIVFPDTQKTKDYNKETSKREDAGTAGEVSEEDRKIIAQHCCASVKRLIAEFSHAEDAAIAEDSIKN